MLYVPRRAALLFSVFAWGQGCAQSATEPRDPAERSDIDARVPADPTGREDGDASLSGRRDAGVDSCNQVDLSFEARQPTVLVLVDRSGSMWDMGLWDPLKRGVLDAVERLQNDVRFGFVSYTGQQGRTCPELSATTPIALGNAAAIRRAYDALDKPSYKSETPTAAALTEVTIRLAEEPAIGPKYVVLVTDGEPDFCDDGNVECARDALVAAAQAAHAKGIGTFVFSVGGQVSRMHLEDVANAGAGQPVAQRSQCANARAAYAPVGSAAGSAPYFEPDVSNQSALVAALAGVISGVRGCVFDLAGQIQIDLAQASEGVVEIDGVRVPFDPVNGFRMNSATELELTGSACAQLRRPDSKRVFIDFPCEAVLVL